MNENKKFFEEINNYNKLNNFLGRKRKYSENLSTREMAEIKNNLNIKSENVLISVTKDNYELEIEEKDNYKKIHLFKKPFLLYKIYENINKLDIDFITENFVLTKNKYHLLKYDYDLYYTYKNELKNTNSLEDIKIRKNDYLNIFNEKLNDDIINNKENKECSDLKINSYLLVIKSLLPNITDDDLEYKSIYHEFDENSNLISPSDISIKYFYYFILNKDLINKYCN